MSEELGGGACNCLAVRQAARHITQLYDRFLIPVALRTTQYSLLRILERKGPLPIKELAKLLVMDRTTLGRNLQPLERDGLIEITSSRTDGRQRVLGLTPSGLERFERAQELWRQAQAYFESNFGVEQSQKLRETLRSVVSTNFQPVESDPR